MMSQILSIAVLLVCVFLVIAVPTLILYRYGKRQPPKLQSEAYQSGFGGPMVFFLLVEVAFIERFLWLGYLATSSVNWETVGTGLDRFAVIIAVGPNWIQAALGIVMLAVLLKGRSPAALATTLILLWLMGPVAFLVQSWYFSLKAPAIGLFEIFAWTIFWTAYFVVSPRVALTYGTPRGVRYSQEKKPQNET